MQILFDCPKCLRHAQSEVTAASGGVMCSDCQWRRTISAGELKDSIPQVCLVCGCSDLWRQKDFPQSIGIAIVGLGALLSTVAWAYMLPVLALGILMAFALVDMLLYMVMRDRFVCYRCHAIYRHVPDLKRIGTFDLEVNERYRQEAIRLKQAQGSSSSSS